MTNTTYGYTLTPEDQNCALLNEDYCWTTEEQEEWDTVRAYSCLDWENWA